MLTDIEIAAFQVAWFKVFEEQLTKEDAAMKAEQLMRFYALLTEYA